MAAASKWFRKKENERILKFKLKKRIKLIVINVNNNADKHIEELNYDEEIKIKYKLTVLIFIRKSTISTK